jgi:cyclomaltodextrinase / maltogenic alpha-amylase / neopullulanase
MKSVYACLLVILSLLFISTSFSRPSNIKNQKAEQVKTENNFTSDWAGRVVWYQIFPERFRNGDTSNDPDLSSIKGSWPHDSASAWQVHPWTSDWYELQPYERENGKDIWFNLQRRRYGGDIQGIIDKLDYLKDLGIGAIYLNPVFEAPSLHKYDGATFHHIDPHFGPDPSGDKKLVKNEIPDDPSTWVWTEADKLFLKLIDEVHKRDMRIIIDGVFNHMGLNSWAFRDVVANQKNSKYKDWFAIKSWDDSEKRTSFDYEGWFGVRELPELREDENGIVDGPKQYIFDITKRWMDPDGDGNPSDGIDGWRLDVAFCVKHQFWKDWRKHVKSINPDAYITAEIIDPIEDLQPYLQGDEFDAVMNYNYLFACSEYFFDEETAISVSEFDRQLRELREAFPECVTFVQQNLHGSHDTQRMASHLVNRDKYKIRNWGETFEKWKGSNPAYDTRKPNELELKRLKLMLIFQMTYVGAPYIYYGDEAGMWGANDPCSRKPMIWDDMNYKNEKFLPDQSLKPIEDEVQFNPEIFEFYKKIIAIRNENSALQKGSFNTMMIDDINDIYAFTREDDFQQILVILNKSDQTNTIFLNTGHREFYRDLMNEKIIFPVENETLELKIEPNSGKILLKDYYR